MNKKDLKRYIFPIALICLWIVLLGFWTHGFGAFTIYSYTLKSAGPFPREIPPINLIDQDGNTFNIKDLRGKYILLNFMYLECSSVCHYVLGDMNKLSRHLKDLMGKDLMIVSSSFDGDNDGIDSLKRSWRNYGGKKNWLMTSMIPSGAHELQDQLRQLGVWVKKRKDGGFNHSSYIFLIGPNGQVLSVFEPSDKIESIAHAVRELMK